MQDKVFRFLILINFPEQHDHDATQSGTELPRLPGGWARAGCDREHALPGHTRCKASKSNNLNFPLQHRID